MGAVWFIARSQARRRWRALLLLSVLAGTMGGLTMSLVAGASRSASVVDRYSAAQPVIDARVFGSGLERDQLQRVPGVAHVYSNSYVAMNRVDADGKARDGVNGFTYDYRDRLSRGTKVVAGRFPDGSTPTHIAVNEEFVDVYGLGVGDDLSVRMYRDDQVDELQQQIYRPRGPTYTFRIDAVVRQAQDIATDEVRTPPQPGGVAAHQTRAGVLFPYAFWLGHRDEFLDFGEDFDVQLRRGAAGVDAFADALARVTPPDADVGMEPGGNTRQASFDTPVALETKALQALGAAVGIAALVLVTLLLTIEQRSHRDETEPLRAIGMTRGRLRAVAAGRTMPAAALAIVFAAAFAVLTSGHYPIGLGRQLELDGGLQVNVAVLLIGSASTGIAIVVLAALVERRPRERAGRPTLRATFARRLSRWDAPLGPTLGAHMAFESRDGRASGGARAGVAAATALLAVALAVGVWVAGVDEFHDTPARHGWPWDVVIGNSNFALSPGRAATLERDRRFAGITAASYGQVTVDDESVEALVVDDDGTAPLPIVTGHAPHGAREIALGRLTMRRHHLAIGDSAVLSLRNSEFGSAGTAKLTVVGESLAPILGESELADIAVIPDAALSAAGGDVQPQILLATFGDGSDRAATLASLSRDLNEELTVDIVPARAVNLRRVRGVPLAGVGIAGMLAALVLVYTVIAGARNHRHDLAVLRAIGLERSGVRQALRWQAMLLTAVVLAIGLPLGLAAGARVWADVAAGIGIRGTPSMPAWLVIPAIGIVISAVIAVPWTSRFRRHAFVSVLRAD